MNFEIQGKEKYKILGVIEQGVSKNTYIVEGQESKQKYALKMFKEQLQLGENGVNQYHGREIQFIQDSINKKTYHQNLVNFIDLFMDLLTKDNYLIQEYCEGGNLFQYILNNKLSERQQLNIALQICEGVEWLHQLNIVHRDIKPESILVTNKDNKLLFKITDFGYSSFANNFLQSVIGTINYMAPEILKQQQYSKSVDVWSIGCILHEIAYRKQLFNDTSLTELVKMIISFEKLPNDNNQEESILYDIIKYCLNPDPQARITMKNVIQLIQLKLNKLEQIEDNYSLIAKNNENNLEEQKDQKDDVNQSSSLNQNQSLLKKTSSDEMLQLLQSQEQIKKTYQQLMKQFQDGKYINPKEGGFFSYLINKYKVKPNKFYYQNNKYQAICGSDEIFFSTLFHFLLCGQLLACLQNEKLKVKVYKESEEIDTFQRWVIEILQLTIQIDESQKKDQFSTFQQALAQISNVKDIYFRINTYLSWLQDGDYCKQAIQVSKYVYEYKNQNKQLLTQTKLIDIDESFIYIESCVQDGGLYDCYIIGDNQNGEKSIVMQNSYVNAIYNIEKEEDQKSEKITSQLIKQFKDTLIEENIINYLKRKIKNKCEDFFQYHPIENSEQQLEQFGMMQLTD